MSGMNTTIHTIRRAASALALYALAAPGSGAQDSAMALREVLQHFSAHEIRATCRACGR